MKKRLWSLTLTGISLALCLSGCSPPGSGGNSEGNTGDGTKPQVDHVTGLPAAGVPLGKDLLKSAVDQERAYQPADQFSKPFDDGSLAGRSFRLEGNVPSNWWNYDVGAQQLKFDIMADNSVHPGSNDIEPDLSFLKFFDDTTSLGNSDEQNAFGAHVNVDRSIDTQYGIGQADDKAKLGLFRLGKYGVFDNLTKTLHMSPDDGRRVTSSLTYVATGVLTKDSDGHVIGCHEGTHKATISEPQETKYEDCVVSGKLASLKIMDGGKVIASWGGDAD